DHFDVERQPNEHLAFGGGAHYCLGAHLARLEGQLAIGTLVERFEDLALGSDRVEWGPSLFRVPGRLPVTFRAPWTTATMNLYAAIVLGALIVEFAIARVADALNLGALAAPLPSELRRVYDEEGLRRAREYTRERTRFTIVEASVELAALLAFWLAG